MRRSPPVRWAPRLRPQTLRRLYERDAQGILDADLIDEVGYSLYARCQSILQVSDAMNGTIHCPECEAIFQRVQHAEAIRCPGCGWAAAWSEYANTYRTQELGAGGAGEFFRAFVQQWPQAQSPRAKMLLIDQLIHRWHWEAARRRPSFVLGRPVGVNLIEGSREQVLALLEALTYGAGSTADYQVKADWRVRWHEIRARQAAGAAARRHGKRR